MIVVEFKGSKRADDRSMLTCPDCDCATFKIVRQGGSQIPRVECANCETILVGVEVNV